MNRTFIEQLRQVVSDQKYIIGRQYQNESGGCCVIGHALKLVDPDIQFSPEFNGMSIDNLSQSYLFGNTVWALIERSGLSLEHLQHLQEDNDNSPLEFRKHDILAVLEDILEDA
jgi:hypothetical protein